MAQTYTKYLVRFTKTGDAIFIGHLDLMNIFRRAFRRAGVSMRFSEGYNPHPKMAFATTLPVGVESADEWCEAEAETENEGFERRLAEALPEGIGILQVLPAAADSTSIAGLVESCIYTISSEGMHRPLSDFYAAAEIKIVKETPKGKKEVNLKNAVISLAEISGRAIEAKLKAGSSACDIAGWFFPDADSAAVRIRKEKTCLTNSYST
jgi:radical SAM-linked protein